MKTKIISILSLFLIISNICTAKVITDSLTIHATNENSSVPYSIEKSVDGSLISYLNQQTLLVGYSETNSTIYQVYRGYIEFSLQNLRPYASITAATLNLLIDLHLNGGGNSTLKINEIQGGYLPAGGYGTESDWLDLAADSTLYTKTVDDATFPVTVKVSGHPLISHILLFRNEGKIGFGLQNGDEYGDEIELSNATTDLYLKIYYTISTPTSAPTGLNYSATSGGCTLTWNNMNQEGYIIYENGDSIGTAIINHYTVNKLSPATSYNFSVRSYNEAGESPMSNTIQVVTKTLPPENVNDNVASNVVQLSWDAVTGASGYIVQVVGNGTPNTTTNTNYTVSGLISNTGYTIYLYSYNISGKSVPDTLIVQTPKYPVPYNVTVTSDPTDYILHWQFNGGGPTGFHIYEEIPEHELVGTVYGNAYINSFPISKSTLTYNNEYIYAIFAYDGGGEGTGAGIGFYYSGTQSASLKSSIVNNSSGNQANLSFVFNSIDDLTNLPFVNNSIGNLSNLSLFPNPVVNKLYIKGIIGQTNVTVMNLEGQTVKTSHLQLGIGSQTGFIDLSELNSGIYLVEIRYNNKFIIKKIVKK